MKLRTLGPAAFKDLMLSKKKLIDVRAPVEFQKGHIPDSVNLPIMNDEERTLVGTTYKSDGQEAAIKLGHQLVSGHIQDQRIQSWINEIQKNPESSVLTCFRGGLRSQITQEWLLKRGYDLPRVEGGYKALRAFLSTELGSRSRRSFVVISGATGSGKSLLIRELSASRPAVDLEHLALHRGSAFGGLLKPQPTQIDFENLLSLELLKIDHTEAGVEIRKENILLEDESRMIGRCVLPEELFNSLRSSPLVLVEEELESRIQVTLNEYVLQVERKDQEVVFSRYLQSLQSVSKKLGHLRFQEVQSDLLNAIEGSKEGNHELHRSWIEKLLVWYYDPMYLKSLSLRNPKVIFKGTRSECSDFLQQQRLV